MQPYISPSIKNEESNSSSEKELDNDSDNSTINDEPYSMFDQINQRRIFYYSDFDIDVTDWKTEKEKLNIFRKTLLEELSNYYHINNSHKLGCNAQ